MSLQVFPDAQALAQGAALALAGLIETAQNARGMCRIALSGGSTPRRLHHALATAPLAGRIDWTRCAFYFGDERVVPLSDERSNARMAQETLFQPLGIPTAQIFPMVLDPKQPEAEAQRYEALLQRFDGVFDIVLLGMGSDGHCASLFPDTPALLETHRRVVANLAPQLDPPRLTLTYPALEAAREVAVLVSGPDKAATLAQVMTGDSRLPLGRLAARRPLHWWLDAEAGHLIATPTTET
ncbi:MAG: 6-phosphogluconolactonase [Pseudomonadota bacterium]